MGPLSLAIDRTRGDTKLLEAREQLLEGLHIILAQVILQVMPVRTNASHGIDVGRNTFSAPAFQCTVGALLSSEHSPYFADESKLIGGVAESRRLLVDESTDFWEAEGSLWSRTFGALVSYFAHVGRSMLRYPCGRGSVLGNISSLPRHYLYRMATHSECPDSHTDLRVEAEKR